jgi:polyisoprenoid-binding protein YceI
MTYGIERRSYIAPAAVFFMCGVLLTTVGCDRSIKGSQPAVGGNVGGRVDPAPPATNPSAIQYVNSTDAGQALVSGTSTLHDWTVKSTLIKGNAGFSGPLKTDSASAIALQSIDLVIPVESLKSTEGSGMDETMYDALKLKQFPTITFHLSRASLKSSPSAPGSPYHFDATGQLTVAGSAHPMNLDLAILPHDDTGLTITTDAGLKMTDFGVTPPTAMLGMIKSGDAITVKVTWQLTLQSSQARTGK